MNKLMLHILFFLRIAGWKCTCPRCEVTHYALTGNNAVLAINHKSDCKYRYHGMQTKFSAKKLLVKTSVY